MRLNFDFWLKAWHGKSQALGYLHGPPKYGYLGADLRHLQPSCETSPKGDHANVVSRASLLAIEPSSGFSALSLSLVLHFQPLTPHKALDSARAVMFKAAGPYLIF